MKHNSESLIILFLSIYFNILFLSKKEHLLITSLWKALAYLMTFGHHDSRVNCVCWSSSGESLAAWGSGCPLCRRRGGTGALPLPQGPWLYAKPTQQDDGKIKTYAGLLKLAPTGSGRDLHHKFSQDSHQRSEPCTASVLDLGAMHPQGCVNWDEKNVFIFMNS